MGAQIDRKIELAESLARERELEYRRANSPLMRAAKATPTLEERMRVAADLMLGALSSVCMPRRMPMLGGNAVAAGLTALVLGTSVTLAGTGVVARVGEIIVVSAFDTRSLVIETMLREHSNAKANTMKFVLASSQELDSVVSVLTRANDTRVAAIPAAVIDSFEQAHAPVEVTRLAFERAHEVSSAYPDVLTSAEVISLAAYTASHADQIIAVAAREAMLGYARIGAYTLSDIETVLAFHARGVESAGEKLLSLGASARDASIHMPLTIGYAFVRVPDLSASFYEAGVYAYAENIEKVPDAIVGSLFQIGSLAGGSVAAGIQGAPRAYEQSVMAFTEGSVFAASTFAEGSYALGTGSHMIVAGFLKEEDQAIARSVAAARLALGTDDTGTTYTATAIHSVPSLAIADKTLGLMRGVAFRIENADISALPASSFASLDPVLLPGFLHNMTAVLVRAVGSALHSVFGSHSATSTNLTATLAGGLFTNFTTPFTTVMAVAITELIVVDTPFTNATIATSSPAHVVPSHSLSVEIKGIANPVNLTSWVAETSNQLTVTDNGTSSTAPSLPSIIVIGSAQPTMVEGNDTVSVFGGSVRATVVEAIDYIAGPYVLVTSTAATSAFSGNIAAGREASFEATASDLLTMDSSIASSLIPFANSTRDFGTADSYQHRGRVDELVADNLSAVSGSIVGTISSSPSINNNALSSGEAGTSLIFDRGTASSNAFLAWNSSPDRLELDTPAFFANGIYTNASTTALVVSGTADAVPLAEDAASPLSINFMPKRSADTLLNSLTYDSGTQEGINVSPNLNGFFTVNSTKIVLAEGDTFRHHDNSSATRFPILARHNDSSSTVFDSDAIDFSSRAGSRGIMPQTYSWKAGTDSYDGGVEYSSGFIAQNVGADLPEATTDPPAVVEEAIPPTSAPP